MLKRLRGTPLPAWAYIGGVLGSTIVVFAIEAVALIVLGELLFDVPFPDRYLLARRSRCCSACSAFAAMGIGLTAVIRSAEGSSAVVNADLPADGVHRRLVLLTARFPHFLEVIADVLPLTYFIRLMRDILLHDAQIWDQPEAVAVIAAWGAFGALVAFRRFRWEPREA